jgi:hypothetical protein
MVSGEIAWCYHEQFTVEQICDIIYFYFDCVSVYCW